jgi:hypothetical protein
LEVSKGGLRLLERQRDQLDRVASLVVCDANAGMCQHPAHQALNSDIDAPERGREGRILLGDARLISAAQGDSAVVRLLPKPLGDIGSRPLPADSDNPWFIVHDYLGKVIVISALRCMSLSASKAALQFRKARINSC